MIYKDSKGKIWIRAGMVLRKETLCEQWDSEEETVYVGCPTEESDHNCDMMGCGYEHVIDREKRNGNAEVAD